MLTVHICFVNSIYDRYIQVFQLEILGDARVEFIWMDLQAPPIRKGMRNHERFLNDCHICVTVLMAKSTVKMIAATIEGSYR